MDKNTNYPNKSEQRVGDALGKIGITVCYQYKVGPFTLDIFLPQYNACIEIYGPHHIERERQKSDKARQNYLESLGIMVYIITAQDTYDSQVVKQLVNKVVAENTNKPKGKAQSTETFNNMMTQMTEWMNKNPFPKEESEKVSVTPKAPKIEENDFASLLDKYYPDKTNKRK